MSSEIFSPYGVNIVQDNELGILIESRILKLRGTWKLSSDVVGEIDHQLLSLLNYDYIINIDSHNQLVHPDDIPILIKQVRQCTKDSECHFRIRVIQSDKTIRKFQCKGRLVDPSKEIATEELNNVAEMETNLELELKLFQYAELAAETGTFRWNLENNTIFFSENVYRILGLSDTDKALTWEDLTRFVYKNDRHKVGEASSVIQQSRAVTKIDFRIERPDGSLRYIRAKAEIYVARSGKRFCIGVMHDVTSQRVAEIRLSEIEKELKDVIYDYNAKSENVIDESQELLQTIAESQTQALSAFKAIRDKDNKVIDFEWTFANGAAERFAGGRKVVGLRYLSIYPGGAVEGVLDFLRGVLDSGESREKEIFYDRDGLNGWFRVIAMKWRDGLVVIGEDVTSRKKTEILMKEQAHDLVNSRDELKLQKELLQRCLDAMPQLVWTTDPLGNFLMFNDRWYNFTGLPHEHAQGTNYVTSGVIHPSHLKEVQAKWQFSINEGLPYINETLIRNKEGEYRWHLDLVTPIKNESGEIIMWVGTLTDVHEQFVAEQRLEEHKNLLEAILNSSKDGIQVLDCIRDDDDYHISDFEWKYCNTVAKEKIFGKDLIQKRLTNEYSESLSDGLFDRLKMVMMRGDPAEFEYSLKRDGNDLCFNVTAIKLEDSVVVTLQDVTPHVKSEKELNFLNTSLQQKNIELENMNEQLSTFAFVASHDLREPLRKIQFYVNAIRQDEKVRLSLKSEGYFDSIVSAVERMNSMINDVLKFSRSNNTSETFHEIDLSKVLTLATNDLSEAIRERKALIRSNNLPSMKGNQTQIIQLLENLLSNAIKFHKPGEKPVVDVIGKVLNGNAMEHPHADPDRKYISLQVTDNGIGFDEQYLPRIFQMFQRLHGMAEYPGTGMGLAICKKIVENHGGFMVARSKPGQGATFTCYFPVR